MTTFLSRLELESLMTPSEGAHVSLFMPTHRVGRETRQNRIRLKNLIRAAEKQLIEMRYRVPDAKALIAARRNVVYVCLVDVGGQLGCDRVEEPGDLVFLALGDQLDLPVGQIADVTAHGKALGQALGRVAEADALHAAGIVYAFTDGHRLRVCYGLLRSGPPEGSLR